VRSVVALQVLLHVIVSWHVVFWKGVSTESYDLKTNCFELQRKVSLLIKCQKAISSTSID
jgi:hypothetical protein